MIPLCCGAGKDEAPGISTSSANPQDASPRQGGSKAVLGNVCFQHLQVPRSTYGMASTLDQTVKQTEA